MSSFWEGQWVITKDKKKMGYVEEIMYSEYHDEPKITMKLPFGKVSIQRDLSELEDYETPKLTISDSEALRALFIDMALLTKDKSWFKELI